MDDASALVRGVVLAILLFGWCGCDLITNPNSDEQKDPHFLTGKNRINSMDYPGAVEAFEKALENNPRSAAAHFELGLLYVQHVTNYPSAIYHFNRYLALRPTTEHTNIIRQQITSCYQEMCRTFSWGAATPAMQSQMSKYAEENKQLRQQIDGLNRRLAEFTNTLASGASQSVITPVPAVSNAPPATVDSPKPALATEGVRPATTPARPASTGASPQTTRTHIIQRNETMAQVARRYGIKLSSLQAANPRVDPRRLKVGQRLNIPPQ